MGDKLNKGILLTLEPVKLLKQCCRLELCPLIGFGPRGSDDKWSESRTNRAGHCLLSELQRTWLGQGSAPSALFSQVFPQNA